MKKTLFKSVALMFILSALALFSTACKDENTPSDHTCTFDREVAAPEHLHTESTCMAAGIYYKSCECGKNGTETFSYGAIGTHSYINSIYCRFCQLECKHDDAHDGSCPTCGAKEQTFTVNVSTQAKMPLKLVGLQVEKDGDYYGYNITDTNGNAQFTLWQYTEYLVKFQNPDEDCKGYIVDENGYLINSTATEIILTSAVIPSDSEDDYKNISYTLGSVVYDFTLTAIDGSHLTLSELLADGKSGVFLNFWFSNCGPCKMEFPYIQAAYESYGDKIAVIGINPTDESDETITAFAQNLGLTFDMVNGGAALAKAFGVYQNGYPTSVFIDRYGAVTFIKSGMLSQESSLDTLFEKALSETYTQILYEKESDITAATE